MPSNFPPKDATDVIRLGNSRRMLGHASNLGRGDRGKFAATVMVDFRDL